MPPASTITSPFSVSNQCRVNLNPFTHLEWLRHRQSRLATCPGKLPFPSHHVLGVNGDEFDLAGVNSRGRCCNVWFSASHFDGVTLHCVLQPLSLACMWLWESWSKWHMHRCFIKSNHVWWTHLQIRRAKTILTFTFKHLADALSKATYMHSSYVLHFISSCFPWESNPWSWRC